MIEDFLSSLSESANFKQAVFLKKFSGLSSSAKSAVLAALSKKKNKIFFITFTSEEAGWIKQELSVFAPHLRAEIFPAPDALPSEEKPSSEITGQRQKILSDIYEDEAGIYLAPIRAVMHKTRKPLNLILEKGKDYPLDDIIQKLIEFGYKRLTIVGERGEFSVKGGIVDVFPSNEGEPKRIEFFGDKIESMRAFDPVTQRSKNEAEKTIVFQNEEERDASLLSILPKDILLLFDEENLLRINAERLLDDAKSFDPDVASGLDPFKEIMAEAESFDKISFSSFLPPGEEPVFIYPRSYFNDFESIKDIPKKVIVISQHAARFDARRARLQDMPSIVGQIRGGLELPNYIVLSDRELFNVEPLKPKAKAKKNEGVGEDVRADFVIGDHVVHEDYGIALYKGFKKIEEGDYIYLEFLGGDKLYVPPNLTYKLEKYSSSEGYEPKLSKMGSLQWKNLKSRAKKSVKDLTHELLSLYADREKVERDPYPKDDVWQKELEDSFPYEETDDQLKAIADVKRDLESGKPMDRLICGDVGYGKTEVALRAMAKAASSGKQVAVLVPTTILAEQHYHFFNERLSAFPFKISALSRFRTKDEQKKIIEELKLGGVDIIVGTHRLLQKDVAFKDLGLLVIDEEHRFGVRAKERLKKIKKDIDILSMTATPIPRTLYFSLSGARDLSLIQTPPADRSPVKTYIAAFNHALIREAILRELDRGGQIFFVHNYIETIGNIAVLLKHLLPEISIALAHGRMKGSELEKIMGEFLDRKHQLLLSTAIIESGLDMPNVNTIIIDKADRLGLAQLYQLRGRVGRSPVKAYSYLLYHPEEVATQTALARLQAIQEFTSLGAGYKLALRDLEIRGAGNLLGAEQHGHMLAVGFDLYCELLSEAVNEIKGIKKPLRPRAAMAVPKGAYIPVDYIEDEQQRIAIYRRINLLSSIEEVLDLKSELRDRFGLMPPPCLFLFDKVQEIISRAGL